MGQADMSSTEDSQCACGDACLPGIIILAIACLYLNTSHHRGKPASIGQLTNGKPQYVQVLICGLSTFIKILG